MPCHVTGALVKAPQPRHLLVSELKAVYNPKPNLDFPLQGSRLPLSFSRMHP